MQFLVLLIASLAGFITAAVLGVRGLMAVFRRTGRIEGAVWLRPAALLVGGAAIFMYMWGTLHVTLAVMQAEDGGTNSSPPGPCRAAGLDKASHVDGYRVSYLPIRFECRLDSGGAYASSSVPGYVNPAVAVLGLTAVTCGVLTAVAGERAGRKPYLDSSRGHGS
ncbi:hypothetical protein [Streptomyces sp. NPDC047000]|uniref:hypothetical protein n=1 Tax=Streptomyces sp. NPDC047000 TaxID=3155474 RepID=UPI0033FD5E87